MMWLLAATPCGNACFVTWSTSLANVAALFGSITAAIAITNAAAVSWRTGPGRRRAWALNYRKLTPLVRPSYVEQLYGKPTYVRTYDARRIVFDANGRRQDVDLPIDVSIWPLGLDGFLMTWCAEDQVIAYSLTTSSRKFHPKITIGNSLGDHADIRLGKTRYSQLTLESPPASWLSLTGQEYAYFERYTFAAVVDKRSWFCGFCASGYRQQMGELFTGSSNGEFGDSPDANLEEVRQEFRSRTAINSVLIALENDIDLGLESTGPSAVYAEMLSSRPARWHAWRWRRRTFLGTRI